MCQMDVKWELLDRCVKLTSHVKRCKQLNVTAKTVIDILNQARDFRLLKYIFNNSKP